MDWSIHVNSEFEIRSDLSALEVLSLDTGSKLTPVVDLTRRLIEEYFGSVAFTRCAYGNEFCEHLIPSAQQLKAVLTAAHDREMSVTFLTPYVSDAGIESLKPLFELLDQDGAGEVVFNDWGVLNLLRREFPRLRPVQGRLMNKSLRDPRVTGVYASSEAPAPALVSLRRSNLDCTSYTGFLSGLGVDSVELDNLPQGVDLSFAENGVKASAYVPFGFISTSRICMAAGIHYDKRDKFQPGAPCHHECQTHLLEYTYTNTPFENRDQKFYLKGNSYFYVHTEAMLRALFDQSRSGLIDRIVFQPRLPMIWERG
ncbi:MAG TPA: hypothetical protein VFF31_18935 [Blastocatellia bacterium]|nr:hypothetical protein [Blastocatellia bacterium]